MEDLLNLIRRECARVIGTRSGTRIGIVDSYDKANHAAKVLMQPEGNLSGWLPIGAAAAGNGFGVHFAPQIGDQVMVHYLDGDHDSGVIGMRLYSDGDRPLPVPAGELWLVQQTGSAVKFHGDGSVELIANANLSITAPGGVQINSPGVTTSGNLSAGTGITTSFPTPTGQTVTVQNGIITNLH